MHLWNHHMYILKLHIIYKVCLNKAGGNFCPAFSSFLCSFVNLDMKVCRGYPPSPHSYLITEVLCVLLKIPITNRYYVLWKSALLQPRAPLHLTAGWGLRAEVSPHTPQPGCVACRLEGTDRVSCGQTKKTWGLW